MASADPSMRSWLWYSTRTPRCIQLDRRAYGEMPHDGRIVPWAEWVCRAPDGGIHVNAGLRQIDVEVSEPPSARDEVSWTYNYIIRLLAHSWLDEIRDLIDESRMGLGVLRVSGEVVPGWSTIRERRAPAMRATEGRTKTCPVCGDNYTLIHGREYFADPEVIGRPLIVNGSGLFVREDIARSRRLRTPRGSYEPGVVKFEAPDG
jgi:hypothetical protein